MTTLTAPEALTIDPLGRQLTWPEVDEATRVALKISPEVMHYMMLRGHGVPMCPPSVKTPEAGDVDPECVFSIEAVDRVMNSFHHLAHVTGRLAGKPLDPDPWQVAYIIAPIFGWLHWDDDAETYVRRVTVAYVDVPRKNGKTTIAGGIGIYMTAADGEAGAQVLAAATTKDQAGFTFAPIRALAKASPSLKGHVKAYQGVINHPDSGSYFKPIANVGDAQHGANVHCAIVDELHLHKDGVLIEAIETGTGSRTQPLVLFITTADTSRQDTPYQAKRSRVEQLAAGGLLDPSTYGCVWSADRDADPFAERTWASCNPGYGVSPTRRFMREQALKAQQSPADLASFQRLHLGIRTKQLTKYITMEAWAANAGTPPTLITAAGEPPDTANEALWRKLRGREAWGGLDLATTSDVSALCWVLPRDKRRGFDVVWRMWVPEESVAELDKRTANNASVWIRDGWLSTTPGNVTDYDYIQREIESDGKHFKLKTLAYDRWNSSQLVNNLVESGVVEMVSVAQTAVGLNAPTQELKRLLLKGTPTKANPTASPTLVHYGNPVMHWMIDNFAVAMDPSGNVKPDKAESGEKIDGVVALIMALSEAMLAIEAPRKSMYDDNDVEFA
jgi:phage terminase large subunit-like protein